VAAAVGDGPGVPVGVEVGGALGVAVAGCVGLGEDVGVAATVGVAEAGERLGLSDGVEPAGTLIVTQPISIPPTTASAPSDRDT
jgi:hypothetical protein